ncbi:VWA domain-containing protein [bacterium]|nr:VWA domain-containing protein [bacterium]
MFRFAFPNIIYLTALIPLLVVFFVLVFRQKRRAMSLFASSDLFQKLSQSVSRKRQIWKVVLSIVVVFLLILSLARPQLGTRLRPVEREGQDIIIALDVSLSMLAEDIKPNRLEKAKHEISSFVNRLQGDRIGLIAFSGKAFVQCPLTLDYGAANMFLNVMEPELIPVPGTALGEAIEKAITSFVEEERKYKVLILITDGEGHVGDPLETVKVASKEGVVIYCVGIGSSQGVPIPLIDERGNRTGFKKDRNDEVVMTKLDELTLEKIALETGGKYYRASTGEVELDKIYSDIEDMEKKELSSQQFAQYEDRFQGLLGVALFLLIMEVLIPERRREKREWKGRFQ